MDQKKELKLAAGATDRNNSQDLGKKIAVCLRTNLAAREFHTASF